MKQLASTFILVMMAIVVGAQNVRVSKSFDNESVAVEAIIKDMATSEFAHVGYTPTFSQGLKGRALNLTDEVEVRIPIALETAETPTYNEGFAVGIWVKTKTGAQQGTPIMTNKKRLEKNNPGWIIGTATSGAWFFNISDGKNSYNYEPTHQRQAINDGRWHHIAISVDMAKKEMWLYFDGQNVAIYNMEDLSANLESTLKTVIGGSDEYSDWGSRGEWTAFNGMIDEVEIYNTPIAQAEVSSTYQHFFPDTKLLEPIVPSKIKIQTWNIWHGGHRYGEHVGVARVIDILKEENADVIGLVETYGSGAIIADSLGYYFYLISSNLSIMSRYPIENTIQVFKSFFSGGALLNLGEGKKIAFFDIWLNYSPDVCTLFKGQSVVDELLVAEKNTRQKEIATILTEIQPYINNADKIPVFMVGDFNSGSHLDWTEETKELHYGMVLDWEVSRKMLKAGFEDSYRIMNPDPLKDPGFTWSPLINNASPNQNCVRDRIDFIYYKGKDIVPFRSRSFEDYPKFWPSDHGSLISYFYLK